MRWHFRARDLSWEDYLDVLPQLRRKSANRPALVLPWVQDGLEDWPSALARGRRIVEAMTLEERLNPERISLADRERIGIESGTSPVDVERLLTHYGSLRNNARQYQALSLWQKIKWMIGHEAPLGISRDQ